MSDGLFYLYSNLACNLVMLACSGWLLTDRHLSRLVRASHAFIAAGAVVTVTGMVADLSGHQDVHFGHIWPGEVTTNVGTAVLLVVLVWRSVERRRLRERPGEGA